MAGKEKVFENRIKKYLEKNNCWFVKFFANAYTSSGIPLISYVVLTDALWELKLNKNMDDLRYYKKCIY